MFTSRSSDRFRPALSLIENICLITSADWIAGADVRELASSSLLVADDASVAAAELGSLMLLFKNGWAELSPFAVDEMPAPDSAGFVDWLVAAVGAGDVDENYYFVPWIALTDSGIALAARVRKKIGWKDQVRKHDGGFSWTW